MNNIRSKSDRLKWNRDVIYALSEEYGFKLKRHTQFHFTLIHPENGRLDYWPSSSVAQWITKSHTPKGSPFKIEDIEAYLMEHFNPENKNKVDPIAELNKRISDLERRLRKLETLYYTTKTDGDE